MQNEFQGDPKVAMSRILATLSPFPFDAMLAPYNAGDAT